MAKTQIQVLLIEDNPVDVVLLRETLAQDALNAFNVTVAERIDAAAEILHQNSFQIILLDLGLPDMQGLEVFARIQELAPAIPKVILSGLTNETLALQAVQAGAQDYLVKGTPGFSIAARAIRHAIERQQTHEALRASEARYHQVLDTMLEGCQIIGFDWRYIYINHAAETHNRRPKAELLGNRYMDMWPGIETTEVFAVIRRSLEERVVIQMENEFTFPDGSMGCFNLSIQPVPEGVFILSTDITESRIARDTLRASEERYRYLFENNPHPMWAYDLNTLEFLAVNDAAIDKYGYTREEFLGMTIADIRPVEDRQRLKESITQPHSDPLKHAGEWRHKLKDGSIITVDISSHTLNLAGRASALVVAQDITDRKLAEAAVRISEERFRAMIENGLDDISLLDRDGNLLWESPAVIRNLGYPENAFVGRNIFEIVYPDDKAWTSDLYAKLLQTPGGRQNGIFRLLRADGAWRWVEAIVTNMLDNPSIQAIVVNYRDITERKQAEEALRESEIRLSAIFQQSPVGIVMTHPTDGKIVDVNETFARLHGYTREELIGNSSIDLNLWANPVEREEMIQQLREQGACRDLEIKARKKNGETRDLLISVEKIELAGEQLTLGMAQDITARKQMEEALRASETRYRGIFNGVQDAIFVESLKGEIVDVNQRGCEIFGYSHAEFITKQVIDIVPSEEHLIRLWEDENISLEHSYETINMRANGEQFPVEIRGGFYEFGDRKLFLVVLRDITERKKTEEALKETSEQFRTLFEASPEAIMIVDPHGDWNILDCNATSCAMNGYTRDELIGHSVDIFNITSGNPTGRAAYLERVRAAGVLRYETSHRRKDGTIFPIEVSTSIITLGGREVILGIDRDITERKQAEDALRESEALYRQAIEVAGAVPYRESYSDDGKAIKYEFIGEGIRQITGYGPEEFNTQLWDLLTEDAQLVDDLQGYTIDEGIERVRSGENPIWKCEYRIRDRAGKTHWVFEAAVELRDEHGISHGSIGMFQDITTRKEADEKIRESEARFASIFHTNPTRVSITSFETGRFLDVNEAFLEASGYTREEVLGITSQALGDWVDPQARLRFRKLLNEDGHVHNFETRLRHRSGKLLDTLISAEMVELFGERCILSVGLDITNRKQAENDLRSSEERFRQLAENIQEVFWITDAITGEDLYISPAGEQVWGHSIETLMHTPDIFINTIIPEDRPAVLRTIENQRSGQKTEVEYRIARPDGSILWIWDRAFPIFDDSGKVVRLAGIAADITERKRSDQALRESEIRFAGVVNSAMDAVISVDSDQKIALFNPAAEQMFGCAARDAIGSPLERFIPQRYRTQHKEHISRFGKTGNTSRTMGHLNMLSGLRSDGTEFPVEASISHIERGEQHLYTVILRDITERKQAEDALHKNEQRLRIALAATNIAVFHQDLDLRYTWMYQPQLGYTSDQVVGRTDADLLPPQDAPGIMQVKRRAMEMKRRERAEVAVHVNDQTTYFDLIVEPLLDNKGMIIGITGSTLDITEHKKAEIETHRHLAELEALYENGLAVGRLLNQTEIGERIIATFARHLSWHHVAIRLLEPERKELRLIAFNQEGLNATEMNAVELLLNSVISKVGQGLSGWVAQTGQALRTGNVHEQSSYIHTYPDIQSGLYMPLKIGDICIGVISVESEQPNAFTEQDERLLATLANQAAIAFENARLYQSAQQELLERKRMEAELRISEKHYRELADSITDIFFELDRDLVYTHWNKASESLTGVASRDAIGKSMSEIFGASDEQARIEKIYNDVLVHQRPRTFETPFHVNGHPRAFEVNAYPSTHGVSVVAKDVTERKRSEIIMQKRFELMEYSAQHSLEELMQKAIDEVSSLTESHIAFFHLMETDQATPKLQIWSTNTLNLFNVAVSEGKHRPVEQAGVWADAIRQRRAVIHNDHASLPNRKGLPVGHTPIVRNLVVPVIRNEKILAVLGVANKSENYTRQDIEIAERFADYAWDITERKQMEVVLAEERNQLAKRVEERTSDLSRANSNLARALRVKDEFLANMSHELRTPLNAILGLSESLAEQTAGPLNEKQQRYINTVSESGHHLLSLINDILDLAKIEAGQIKLDVNKVDIHSVCDASLRMIKQLARKKNQDVALEIDQKLNLMWADERRLKQMLVNLLSNAVKFTPEGGKLGLEVHGNADQNKVTFTIWDTGIGIKDSDLPRLFKPFVQLDAGLARESSGTGLGLALVAQMAHMHGGSASVTSQPGEGSRFTLMLPWEPALAVDPIERLKATGKFRPIKFNPGQKPTILLIEDTEEVIMMVSDYLEMNGFKTVIARDGVEGIAQAQIAHPDLILMDIQMPRMNGFETAQKLRTEPEFKHTPIIALTALAMPNDRERCLAAGMDEYITKPVHLRGLIKIIENFLSGEHEVKPQ